MRAPVTGMSPAALPGQESRPLSVQSLQLNEVLTEVLPLLETAESPASFFGPYLQKVRKITNSPAAAAWLRTPKGAFERAFDCGWDLAIASDSARAAHSFLLEEAAALGRTVWLSLPPETLPPSDASNSQASVKPGSLGFLFAPILVERKLVGFLEVVLTPPGDRELKRFLTRLTTELAGVAAAFLHKRDWLELQEHQAFFQDLDGFSAQVHQSLVPSEVAFVLAHEGKKIVGCDQLSVALRKGNVLKITSVSGALAVEAKSPLARAMTDLAVRVAAWGETLRYEGSRDESLPPPVVEALDRYLALSNPLTLVVYPLATPNQGEVGVLLAESFEKAAPVEKMHARLEALARHGAPALANALAHDELPLQWLTRPLASLGARGKSRFSRWAVRLGVLALVVLLICGIRLPRRMEASGQLVPRERRIIYAGRSGKVLDLAVKHGDKVEKGQDLLFLEDLETQLKVDQLLVKMSSFDQKIAFLDEHLAKNLLPKERTDLLSERIKADYELNKAKAERDLLLAEVRNPRKAGVPSPLAGRVITFDPKEKLAGKMVKVGDPLLRVAEVDGPWEVELFLPESSIGPIREALASSTSLEVQLLVASDPHRNYTGTLTAEGLGGETMIREDKVVLPARVTLTDRALLNQLLHMPVGVEVQARIDCGREPAGYVWFNEFWDYVYRRFIF